MVFTHKWSSARNRFRSKHTPGSKRTAKWSATSLIRLNCTSSLLGAEAFAGGPIVSIQFGRWNVDGKPTDREYFDEAESLVATYGPDYATHYFSGSVGILYPAFCTTKQSWTELPPRILPSAGVLT